MSANKGPNKSVGKYFKKISGGRLLGTREHVDRPVLNVNESLNFQNQTELDLKHIREYCLH